MPYAIPSFEFLRANYLRDVKNLDPQAHVDADSDNHIRGSATASAVHGLYHHQNWIARQILPSTADPENLEQHAANRGMYLKPAAKADGTITLAATAGTVPAFGAGLAVTYLAGEAGEEIPLSIVATEGWPGGPAPAEGITLAAQAGQAGNFPALNNALVTVQTAPDGIASEASATMYGGADAETHEALLARLLFRMRNPPSGGIATDYVLWAMEVPGITWAKCYPARRGIGTVDVVVLSSNGIPGPQLVAAVQSHVDAKRPVTCPDCMAFAPVVAQVPIIAPVRIAPGSGLTLPALAPSITRELDSRYFDSLYPGDDFRVNRALAVLIGVSGVDDADISSPAANITGHALTWFRQGLLTLEPW